MLILISEMKMQANGKRLKMINKFKLAQAELFGSTMFNFEDKYSKININAVPVMITDSNRILCIPTEKELFHIGVTGATGKGKGIVGNNILGWEYWLTKRSCMILNDFQRETFEQSLPCLDKKFQENLKTINAKPTPLPIVYVYPSNKHLEMDEVEILFPHIKMSLPTRSLIQDIEKYYQLGKSGKYFTANIDKFVECRDLEEIDDALKEIIEENVEEYKNRKALENMMFKIRTVFKNIFDEMITDNSSPEAPAFINVKNDKGEVYNNLVIQALLFARVIPSIQTSNIRSKTWFSAYMSFIVESIYEDKYRDVFMKDSIVAMYVPEIDKMWKEKEGKIIKNSLGLIGTNGRRVGIGLRWDAQDYDSVPDSIRSNTPYLFVLRKSDSKEVVGITKDFNMSTEVRDQILSLESNPQKGLFECVALTTSGRGFALYDQRTGRVTYSNSPQKGRLITPMAQHRTLGVLLKDLIQKWN